MNNRDTHSLSHPQGPTEPFPYADIVELPHHVSPRHTPMSPEGRAAQFAPFAALEGYADCIAAATARHL